MKTIRSEAFTSPRSDIEGSTRFVEEAQIAAQLDHPGIAPVHELGLTSDGKLYFTMRLVQGETLAHVLGRLGQDPATLRVRLEILLKVCETMSFVHSKRIVHRDLKPANIMVGAFGEVYVMDWGLAKVIGDDSVADPACAPDALETLRWCDEGASSAWQTLEGTVVGTPSYMPPEQAEGSIDLLGPHSDVYSIGAMLYEMLTGTAPYSQPGQRRTPIEILSDLRRCEPKRIQPSRKAPRTLVAICEKAMQRAPNARYRDANELREDLRAFLENRVVRAHARGPLAELRAWFRRNRTVASTALITVGVLVIATILWLSRLSSAHRVALEGRTAAERSAREATTERTHAVSRLRRILDLALADEIADLRDRAQGETWPPVPEKLQVLRRWLSDARQVLAREEAVDSEIEALLADATFPGVDADAVRADPMHQELQELESFRAAHEVGHPDASFYRRNTPGMSLEEMLAATDRRIADLRARLRERRVVFEAKDGLSGQQRRWRYRKLLELRSGLRALREDPPRVWGSLGIRNSTYSDMQRRLRFVEHVLHTCQDPEARSGWNELARDLASDARFGDVPHPPWPGLVPLGVDPSTGLWEFWYVPSGDRPRMAPAGDADVSRYAISGDMGMVFVLVPGGETRLGSSSDPNDPRFDEASHASDRPPQRWTLAPFLISKYEMTFGQWTRFEGSHPNELEDPGEEGRRSAHALGMVSWIQADDSLRRLGLALPSEAQWEHACRAGTDTPWSTGQEETTLAGFAWVWERGEPRLSDTQAIGCLRPNDFGLHDMHGNAMEWCLDNFMMPSEARRTGRDGVVLLDESAERVRRGGGFCFPAISARSAWRGAFNPIMRGNYTGVRPLYPLRSEASLQAVAR